MGKRKPRSRSTSSRSKGEAGDAGPAAPKKSEPAHPAPPREDGESDARDLIERLHIWQIQAVRDVLVVAAIIGIVWAGYALRAVTVPLLVALLLAYLFEPLIDRLCRKHDFTRPAAVGSILVVVIGAFVLVVALIVPLIVSRTTEAIEHVSNGTFRTRIERLEQYVPDIAGDDFRRLVRLLPGESGPREPGEIDIDDAALPIDGSESGETPPPDTTAAPGDAGAEGTRPTPVDEARVREIVESVLAERPVAAATEDEGVMSDWLGIGRSSLERIGSIVKTIVGIGFLTFLIPFYFFFFSLWYPQVVRFGRTLIPDKNRARALELLAHMDAVVAGFVRGRIVISLIMGVLLAIGWAICQVPYALPLGLVIGVFCAVPYLGVIGVPMAVGLLLMQELGDPEGEQMVWWAILLWPTVVFAIVQIIEGYALTPMIAGKATNLDPVTILVAVLAGGSVLGVYGMLLAIPIAACGKILFLEVLLPRFHAWTRGEVSDPLPIDKG